MQSEPATGVARPDVGLVKGLTLSALCGELSFGFDTAVIPDHGALA